MTLTKVQRWALEVASRSPGLRLWGPGCASTSTVKALVRRGLIRWDREGCFYRLTPSGQRTRRLLTRHVVIEGLAECVQNTLCREGIGNVTARTGLDRETIERALTVGVKWETYVRVVRIVKPNYVG